ncbi:MAG TPA: hypothetical protein VMT89_14055, partial [Candidatus Acidoferrales bacterium]|nr:hypothetical protein [Candidatus Acidoferrales bacterium]
EVAWSVGTFGCTATRNSNGKPVLLSCSHVLMSHGAAFGDYIFQPAPVDPPNIPVPTQPVLHPGKNDDMIAKIVDSKLTDRVDAAIAELDVSTWCRCCGLDFLDEINGLSKDGTPASNKIVGMRAAVPTKPLYKVGMRTGRTEGILVDPNYSPQDVDIGGTTHSFTGQLLIASVSDTEPFSWSGDSGSAIFDEDGYIVGLLFGGTLQIDANQRSYANQISDVCAALGITINLTMTQTSAGAAAQSISASPYGAMTGAELYGEVRKQLLADPAGAWLFALAEEHREEIVRLVTTRRPVTVAWHRAGGPALFAAALNTLRAGGDALPVPADGGTLEAALAKVGAALEAHGSPALQAAIAAHRYALLDAVKDSARIGELLAKLRRGAVKEAAVLS